MRLVPTYYDLTLTLINTHFVTQHNIHNMVHTACHKLIYAIHMVTHVGTNLVPITKLMI
jgi:hypothetical protein